MIPIAIASKPGPGPPYQLATITDHNSTRSVALLLRVNNWWVANKATATMMSAKPYRKIGHAFVWTRRVNMLDDMTRASSSWNTRAAGKFFVFGGLGPGWIPQGLVYEYDQATDKWTKKKTDDVAGAPCRFH